MAEKMKKKSLLEMDYSPATDIEAHIASIKAGRENIPDSAQSKEDETPKKKSPKRGK